MTDPYSLTITVAKKVNKQLAFLLLVAAFGGVTLTDGRSAETQFGKSAAVTAWPVSKTFVRLNDNRFIGEPDEEVSRWGWATVPVSVFEAARKLFVGKPETWSVSFEEDYEHSGKTVVEISDSVDSVDHAFVCLTGRHQWIRLNDNVGLPFIDQLVRAHWKGKLSTASLDELRNYARALVFLFKGPSNWLLCDEDMEAVRKYPTSINMVLGSEKRASEFTKFLVDPVFTPVGKDMRMVFYVVTGKGAIKKWTAHGKEDKRFVVRDITIETMKKEGSFVYRVID